MRQQGRRVAGTLVVVLLWPILGIVDPHAGAPAAFASPRVTTAARADPSGATRERLASVAWAWPLAPVRVVRPFAAPPHEYGPGHRGIDLAAPLGADVHAPAAGVVAFAGSVAGRGVLTIDQGDGLVTTFEPVDTELAAAAVVTTGDVVATAGLGGHADRGTVHFGVRWNGEYINPMLLLGGIPRAVLLPCC